MKTRRPYFRLLPFAAAACLAGPALATNGYFPHGYGMKAKGMGGVAAALSEDSIGGATNPASMVWAGSRMDVGLDVFMPRRDAERSGAGFATLNGSVDSDRNYFVVPEAGYNRMLRSDLSLGVSVYGNGGMNRSAPMSKRLPVQTIAAGLVAPPRLSCTSAVDAPAMPLAFMP